MTVVTVEVTDPTPQVVAVAVADPASKVVTVDVTAIASIPGTSSGAGAVDSVNGHTGTVVLGATDVGADASGAATTAVAAHVAASDPHPQYLTPAEGGAAYDALGAAATAQSAAISTAATDATTKANAAQAAAVAASQPVDTDLTAIAALSTTTFGRALLTQADAAATRATLGLGTAATAASSAFDAAGAAVAAQAASQPVDSDLTAIAALSTTSFGRSFLALADAAAGRTLLGLGTAATQASSAFDAAGAASAAQAAAIAATNITVQDEGAALTTVATTINFVGTGVKASGTGATKTITIADPHGTAGDVLVSGANYQTIPRYLNLSAQAASSGFLYLFAINLPEGATVSAIGARSSGTASVGLTHSWSGLFDANRVAISLTNDDTTTWAIQSTRIWTLSTPQTALAAGLYYLGICVVATTTMPTWYGITGNTNVTGIAPIESGFANSAQTSPPGLPFTATALTAVASKSWLWTQP